MGWFRATGDEQCVCGKTASEDDEMFYDKVADKVLCLPCKDNELDLMIGKVDAEDPRYNDSGY